MVLKHLMVLILYNKVTVKPYANELKVKIVFTTHQSHLQFIKCLYGHIKHSIFGGFILKATFYISGWYFVNMNMILAKKSDIENRHKT